MKHDWKSYIKNRYFSGVKEMKVTVLDLKITPSKIIKSVIVFPKKFL